MARCDQPYERKDEVAPGYNFYWWEAFAKLSIALSSIGGRLDHGYSVATSTVLFRIFISKF